MDFREILRNLLIEFDCTQTELANKLNIKPSQISEWLKGKANPGYETLRNIATTLNLSADYLLGLEDDFGARLAPIHSDDNNLTTEERQLIEDFRKLNYYKQKLIKDNIKAMLPAEAESEQKKKKA